MSDTAVKADAAFVAAKKRGVRFQTLVMEGPLDLSTLPYVEDRKFIFWSWSPRK